MIWIKSSHSYANGNCVEVRSDRGAVEVRDSTDRDGPVLRFNPADWQRLTERLAVDFAGGRP